jgi:hypothetical protein
LYGRRLQGAAQRTSQFPLCSQNQVQVSTHPPPSHCDNLSTKLLGNKRQRSPAANPEKQSSDDGRVKRHRRDVFCTSRTGLLSGQYLEHDRESQFRATYNAVLALLTDLRLEDSSSLVIDGHTAKLVENICESLMPHPHSVNIILTSDVREIVLASLTASELMSSSADLAAHLLNRLQQQSATADDLPTRTGSMEEENRLQDRPIDHVDSQAKRAVAESNGLTDTAELPSYPSSIPQPILARNELAIEPISLPQDERNRQNRTAQVKGCHRFHGAMYWPWKVREQAVYVCESPKRINAAHLLKAAGLSCACLPGVLHICCVTSTWIVRGNPLLQGTYVNLGRDAEKICGHLKLPYPPDLPPGHDVSLQNTSSSNREQVYCSFHHSHSPSF